MITTHTQPIIGVVTVSDRAYSGVYEDKGGPGILAWLEANVAKPWEPIVTIVPDEEDLIAETLTVLSDRRGCDLILVTGGTGPSPRDVTPEAVQRVCEKILPGFGEQMRRVSLKVVPTAILSRQEAGIRGKTLIITLPGNPSAIKDCLDGVFPAVPYCLELMGAATLKSLPDGIPFFRPKQAKIPEK
jgi:molybdopterin adenylyltransferase